LASVLAQSTIAKTAQKNGLPNTVMMTTTAAYLNTEEGKFAYKFFNDYLEFDESMYSLSRREILELMQTHAKRKFLRIEYPYWELGKDDGYFIEQAELLGWDKDSVDREIFCKWKEVDTSHPLGQDAIMLLDSSIHKPVKTVIVNKIYRVKFYKDPSEIDWSIPYIIGGDCANNIGEDYSALVVIDPRNYEVIAVVRTNMYSTMFFARLIISLMRNFFYNSILVLEHNLNGATILDRILEEDFMLKDRIYASVKRTDILGVTTVTKSRTLLYNQVLKTAVDDSYNYIHDRVIIEEIKGLIKTRSGRIDHVPGGHDDTLISYLFARWFLFFGEKIERYINPLIVGIFSDIEGENEMQNEKRKVEKQMEFLEEERKEKDILKKMFSPREQLSFGGGSYRRLKNRRMQFITILLLALIAGSIPQTGSLTGLAALKTATIPNRKKYSVIKPSMKKSKKKSQKKRKIFISGDPKKLISGRSQSMIRPSLKGKYSLPKT
jgi:hypothetical protein